MTKDNRRGSSNDTKEGAAGGSSSKFDSFSKFTFDDMSSLLPAKPDTNGNENQSSENYVYPIEAFPPISAFEISTEFPALILPVRRTHELRKKLKSIMLSRPRLSVVVELSDNDLDNNDDQDDKPLRLSNENKKMYRKIVLDTVNRPTIILKIKWP